MLDANFARFPLCHGNLESSPKVTLSIRQHAEKRLALAGLFSFTHFKGRAEELECAEISPCHRNLESSPLGDTQLTHHDTIVGKIGICQHTTRRLALAGLFCCIRGDTLRDFPVVMEISRVSP